MRLSHVLMVCLGVGLLLAADEAKDDKDKLKGTWKVESAERDGQPLERAKQDVITFADDKITIKRPNSTEEATFKLDSAKKPQEITITPSEGKEKMLGIYQLDGDTLKICISRSERPTEFSAKAGSQQVLLVFKRQK